MTLSWRHLLLLMVVTMVVYLPALDGGFVSDDNPVIAENPYLTSPEYFSDFFTRGIWQNSAQQSNEGRLYRPLYLTWYYALYQLNGSDAFVFHLANLLLHLINIVLFWKLVALHFPQCKAPPQLLAVTLFALHPVATECIAWISGGTDLLLLLWLISAWINWINRHLVVSLLLFICALLTKETAVVYPLLVAAYLLLSGRDSLVTPANKGYLAGLLLLTVAYLVLRSSVLTAQGGLQIDVAGAGRLLEYSALVLSYLLLPWEMPFYFDYPAGGIADQWDLLMAALALMLLLVVIFKYSQARFGIAWLLLTALPPLGLAFHDPSTFAARFLYLPSIGLALMVAAMTAAHPQIRGRYYYGMTLLLIVPFVYSIRTAIPVWQDNGSFYRQVVADSPAHSSGYEGLAKHHLKHGELERVLEVYRNGVKTVQPQADRLSLLESLALTQGMHGRHSESIKIYRQLAAYEGLKGTAYVGIGNNLWIQGDTLAARRYYSLAIEADGDNFEALYNHARLSEALKDFASAITGYEHLLRLPDRGKHVEEWRHAKEFIQRYTR